MNRLAHRLTRTAAALAFLAMTACSDDLGPPAPDAETIAKLTITARPGTPTITPTIGYSELGLADPRDGFMYVPSSYSPASSAPMLVLFHGAGGNDQLWRSLSIEAMAEAHGMIILATESRYTTWDGVQLGRYDVDVAFLNQAMQHVFARVNVDSTKVAIAGFSDGASEALGIGVANAAIFRKIIAYSPGVLNLIYARGTPDVFVAHGLTDAVTPFQYTRDWTVEVLRRNGMQVEFYPFEGGHAIPSQVETASFNWLNGTAAP